MCVQLCIHSHSPSPDNLLWYFVHVRESFMLTDDLKCKLFIIHVVIILHMYMYMYKYM